MKSKYRPKKDKFLKGKLPEPEEIRKQIQTMNELLQDMDVEMDGHDLHRQVSYIIG